MNKEDIYFMSACDMAEKIKTQELTSLEITETIIERIEKINPKINAYCTPTFDLARETAKKADNSIKKGEKLGLLHGIPTSIKDEMPIKGVRTTFGSRLYEDYIPEEDDICVKRLKNAGCVILGKTNMPPFGFLATTRNLIFGETRNPWNLERTPGGSSGGAAAAIASGLGSLALGADGGGSIRIPSCLCGVYGIKPSFGRVPVYPTLGIHLDSLIQYGPIVRYVKDAALMLDVIKGPHHADQYTLPKQNINYLEKLEEKPNKLKIGYSLDLGFAKVVDSEIKENVVKSVQKFEEFGWTIEPAKIKIRNPERILLTYHTLLYGYDFMGKLKKSRDKMHPDLVKAIEVGIETSGIDFARVISRRKVVYEKFYQYFKNYDILITPTTGMVAFELGIPFPTKINGKIVSPTAWMPFTAVFNITGLPAASIPCGWSSEGLPIGMQIVGNRFDELTVLQVSKAFEEISPWQDKKPQFN
jgi:Asp-tRNA(Asn)/Glu-tRNA(Gln) amidotransferase A subunit family amidase